MVMENFVKARIETQYEDIEEPNWFRAGQSYIDDIVTLKPVSYTHLDVYKRQIYFGYMSSITF